jgi:hypothetical protein
MNAIGTAIKLLEYQNRDDMSMFTNHIIKRAKEEHKEIEEIKKAVEEFIIQVEPCIDGYYITVFCKAAKELRALLR